MNRTTNTTRWHLLTTVSAVALLGSICNAIADDADKPVLWFEAGGQFNQLSDAQESFEPPFIPALLENPFTPPSKVQAPPRYSLGEEARLLFRPEDSDWIFSASIQYGRAGTNRSAHQETPAEPVHVLYSVPAYHFYTNGRRNLNAARFAATSANNSATNLVLDFQAGRDVGLGLFGSEVSSTLSAGVRFAQFTSRSSAEIDSDPDFQFTMKYLHSFRGYPAYVKGVQHQHWHLYAAQEQLQRRFSGVGPIVSWDASMPLAGNPQSEDLTFDWGLNAAVLFGRQKVHGSHRTTGHYNSIHHFSGSLPLTYDRQYAIDRSHTVAVPNLGGFAGLSLKFPNAKMSIGYRADFFFNAVDGGIDARKSENRGFYGPFASISIGVGN